MIKIKIKGMEENMSGRKKIDVVTNTFPLAPLGVSIQNGRLTFSVSIPNASECILKLYRNNKKQPVKQITLSKAHQIGCIFQITLSQEELEGAE